MLDLMLRGGFVVDGTGSAGFKADVGITGERVTIHRGDSTQIETGRVIDVSGLVVCPGFIDLHSHGGLTIFGSPEHEPSVRQGVTTELIGIDGISHAPFKTVEELQRFIWLDSGLNGYPPQPADWLTVADLLGRYDGAVSVNIAYILGNAPVRIWSVGWRDEPATNAQIADMGAVVREAMEEGAYGLSTGLDYPPGSFASTDELVELSRVAQRFGGMYHTHARHKLSLAGNPLAPFEEAIEIGERSGAPIHLTHYASVAWPDLGAEPYLRLIEDARSRGLDVTFDCYSYANASSTSATFFLPSWTKEDGPEGLIAALQSPDDRARIRGQFEDDRPPPDLQREIERRRLRRLFADDRVRPDLHLTNFTQDQNLAYEGKTIHEIAALRQEDALDVYMDLLAEESIGLSYVGDGGSEEMLPAFVAHPLGMFGSDAMYLGEFPSPRTYGNMPRVLGHFSRLGGYAPLEEMIRKMTSFAAQRLGIPDRGILRDGFKADVVVFNPETVGSAATLENPRVFPSGIEHVLVNGQLVIEDGEHTGALPGRALRRGRSET